MSIWDKYDNYKQKVIDLEEKEKEDSEKLATTNILKEKILESEMIAIMNTIDTISTHAHISKIFLFKFYFSLIKKKSNEIRFA